MEKFDWRAHRQDILGWFVIKAVTAVGIEKLKSAGLDASAIDVRMMINGEEVDWQKIVLDWSARLDDQVVAKAKELIEERIGSVVNELNDLEQRIKYIHPWNSLND